MSGSQLPCVVVILGLAVAVACGADDKASEHGRGGGGGAGASAGAGTAGRGDGTAGSVKAGGEGGVGGAGGVTPVASGAGGEGATNSGGAGVGGEAGSGGMDAVGGADNTTLGDGTCSSDGWCWVEPHPQGHALLDASQADGHLWAVGHGGTIVHRTPEGSFSTEVWPNLPVLRGVAAVAADDVWVVGDAGLITHFDGKGWTSVASPTDIPLNDVLAFGPYDIWAVGGDVAKSNGVILHYDGAWHVDDTFSPGPFFALGGTATELWAAGYGSGGSLARRVGGVWEWAPILSGEGLQTFTSFGTFEGDLLLASTSSSLWRRQGSKWNKVTLGFNEPLYGLAATASGLFVLSDRSIHLYDGQNATEQLRFTTIGAGGLAGGSAGLFAAGQAGRIFEQTGNTFELAYGSAWRGTGNRGRVVARADDDVWWLGIRGLHFDGTAWSGGLIPNEPPTGTPGTLWAMLNQTVYRWSGSAWAESVTTQNSLWDLWQAGPEEAWAVGLAGTLLHFDGDKWTTPNAGIGFANLSGVHGSGADNVWIIGADLARRFDGQSWHDEWLVHPTVSLSTVHTLSANSTWVGDTSGGVHHWNGSDWTSYTIDDAIWVSGIAAFSDTDVWAAGLSIGNRSMVAHFDGKSWTRKSLPYAYGVGPLTIQDENTLWLTGDGALLRWRRP